jgi:hypothetical protein
VCPESLVCLQQKTVRQLLSGSLTHTRTKSLSPTCVLHQMLRRALRVFSSYFSVSCYPPKMMSKKLTLVFSPLCRFTSPTPTTTTTTNPPLCICTSVAYLPFPVPVLPPATCLQQDVCRRLILGYNRWYFISCSSYPPSICNVMSIY